MISINKTGKTITIKGHAMHDEYGKDIVCASVSSIVYTTVNGLFNFGSDLIEFKDEDIMIINILKETHEVEVLINNMMTLLEELELKYPKNIKISKGD